MKQHYMTALIERDDDELEVAVTYTVTPYRAATGPTYDCGGQPEEGGEIEIVTAQILLHDIGDVAPADLTDAEEQLIIAKIQVENSHADEDEDDYYRCERWEE